MPAIDVSVRCGVLLRAAREIRATLARGEEAAADDYVAERRRLVATLENGDALLAPDDARTLRAMLDVDRDIVRALADRAAAIRRTLAQVSLARCSLRRYRGSTGETARFDERFG